MIEAIVPTRREPSPKKWGLFPPSAQTGCATRSCPLTARAGILCRTANQMRRAIAQAFATAVHVHCKRAVSGILRHCGLGVGILLGSSVNESSMPPIAHGSRTFAQKRKLSMGWAVRRRSRQHENPSLSNHRGRKPDAIGGGNRVFTHAVAHSN
jgi:hypothetical protein